MGREEADADVGRERRKRSDELAVVNKTREELQRLEQAILARGMRNDYIDPENARAFQAFILHQEASQILMTPD